MEKGITKQEITDRFLTMIDQLVAGGSCRTRGEFCAIIGEHPQNLAKMKKGERAPTLEHLAKACATFGYSPTWLILGTGPVRMKAGTKGAIESRIDALERDLAKLKAVTK